VSDEPARDEPVLRRIVDLLDAGGCPYELIEHDSVSSAREAAAARATELDEGAKAILLKYDGDFGIFVLRAARQVRSARIRRGLKVRRTRFAYEDELLAMTGLRPGAVPPFGEPVLPFPLFADPSIDAHPTMVFTAGSRTTSIRMATSDYRRVARPRELAFAR
jgi:Ala-tRNA(Pro) deacylase